MTGEPGKKKPLTDETSKRATQTKKPSRKRSRAGGSQRREPTRQQTGGTILRYLVNTQGANSPEKFTTKTVWKQRRFQRLCTLLRATPKQKMGTKMDAVQKPHIGKKKNDRSAPDKVMRQQAGVSVEKSTFSPNSL